MPRLCAAVCLDVILVVPSSSLRARDRSCQTTSTGPAMGNGCSFFPDTMRHIRGVNWVQKEAASPSLDLFPSDPGLTGSIDGGSARENGCLGLGLP